MNSRRRTVCTLSTPTSPPGSVSIGTDTIEVKSEPRSDSNGRYRGSDSLSWMITTGSRWLATQPETPCPSGSRILPTSRVERRRRAGQRQRALGVVEHVHEADVGGGGRGDHPGRRRGQRLDAGAAGRGLDQLPQQGQFAVGVDQSRTAFGLAGVGRLTGRSPRAARSPRRRCGR